MRRGAAAERGYCPCCVMVIAVPVIVSVAVRATPVFGATANCTVPLPAPDAPCETVRKLALLVAVHVHEFGVVTEIDAEPPAAGNVVVVTPVMIWQLGLVELLLQPAAAKNSAMAKSVASVRRERWQVFMPKPQARITPVHSRAAARVSLKSG
jgi:hypothetical protein